MLKVQIENSVQAGLVTLYDTVCRLRVLQDLRDNAIKTFREHLLSKYGDDVDEDLRDTVLLCLDAIER